ncbi:hypothetical protein V6N13_094112 [Hibiscus sabdariffa]|uniref:Uncharacterized protein n=2 Tax=Hibiscus sabdariffa TaxID=183260 RepID=A0ABR2BKG0_9ROSI
MTLRGEERHLLQLVVQSVMQMVAGSAVSCLELGVCEGRRIAEVLGIEPVIVEADAVLIVQLRLEDCLKIIQDGQVTIKEMGVQTYDTIGKGRRYSFRGATFHSKASP